MSISGGSLRYNEAQPLIDGQFTIMANAAAALDLKWYWEAKGAPLNVVWGARPVNCDYPLLGVPKNSGTPNLAKLFVAFMVTREAQQIADKLGGQSSHLVPGTRMYRFVRENRIALQDPRKIYALYFAPDTPALYDRLAAIVRQ